GIRTFGVKFIAWKEMPSLHAWFATATGRTRHRCRDLSRAEVWLRCPRRVRSTKTFLAGFARVATRPDLRPRCKESDSLSLTIGVRGAPEDLPDHRRRLLRRSKCIQR